METTNKIDLPELASYFQNEDAAREFLEKLRWPEQPVCPHCGSINDHYRIESKTESKRPSRKGLWKCKDCKKQFTVKVGTIFEDSHIPIHIWLYAIYLLCSSKKGMSAHQLHRTLGVTYKSAWFMAHRIRYAMETDTPLLEKMGGTVECDETYVGGKRRGGLGRGTTKAPVFALVERDGRVKSMQVERVTSKNLKSIIRENVETTSTIMTDDFSSYKGLNKEFYQHKVIRHSRGVYSRPGGVHTNTIEGYFSILKRGIVGIYQHVGKQHLDRYLAEFDFRYNARKVSDGERAIIALKGIEGKRLTYKD
jgi:transposase-like protein